MTPKKTFVTIVVLALVVALGLAAGVLPGAGLMSLRQIVSASQVYNIVSIELDDDYNSVTPAPSTLELTAGEQVWLNALGTYMDGETEYLADLLAEVDVLYSVDPDSPVSLGTIEHNSGEVRVLFTANPTITSPLAGTITAMGVNEEVSSDPLDILVNPVVLAVDFVAPLTGSTLYIGDTGTTDVPLRAETNTPAATSEVNFTQDPDGTPVDIGSDTLEPYDAVVALDSGTIGSDVTFEAEAFDLDEVSADTDRAVVSIAAMPTDGNENGVADDPFDVDDGASYAVVGNVNVTVADVFPPTDVVTADGIGIELPADILDNIEGVDAADIVDVRIIVRTAPDILDILAAEPDGLPDLAELLGDVLDIHMLVELDGGAVVEVHEFNVPITIRIPVSADFAQLFGVATELDVEYDPAAVEGAEFAQSSATISIEGEAPDLVLVFEVYEFTTYVPITAPGAPRIDTVVPNQGTEAGGTQVAIGGDYFASDAAVTIGGAVATVQTVNNPGEEGSSVVVTTGRRAVTAGELVNVRVTNIAEGLFDESAGAFMYLPEPPLIEAIYPSAGTAGSQTTISGDFFDEDVRVVFATVEATVVSATETEIVVEVPAQASLGVVTVTVLNPSSGRSDTTEFEYMEPIVLEGIEPEEGPESGGTEVVITGSGIPAQEDVAVTFGGVAAAVSQVVDSIYIYADTPAFAVNLATAVDVVVAYAGTGLHDTLSGAFTYTPVAPEIDSVDPPSGTYLGGTPVGITGNYFDTNSEVTFGGLAAPVSQVLSSVYIYAVTPPHALGAVDVAVTNPDTGMSDTLSAGYEYTEVLCTQPPVITGVDPTSGSPLGGDDVTILGANFVGVSAVQFGTIDANTFEVVSATEITATTPAHAAGTVGVSVTTPCGTDTLEDAFEFIEGVIPPVIDSIDPTEGVTTGGDEILIIGQNFDTEGDVSVMFGANEAINVVVTSATEISCVSPAGAEGTVAVTVVQASGTSNGVDFLYVVPDLVLSVVGDYVFMPGDPQFDVRVDIENMIEPTCQTIQFSLFYDPAVVRPVEMAQRFVELTLGQAATDAGKITSSARVSEDGEVIVILTDISPPILPIGDGELVYLPFELAPGVVRGDRSPLDIGSIVAVYTPEGTGDVLRLVAGGIDGEVIIGEQPVIDIVDGVAAPGQASGWVGDEVVIQGSGFDATNSAEVYFGTELATILDLTPTSITVVVPDQPGGATDGQQVDITVTNPDENLSATVANGFVYLQFCDVVVITGVVPNSGTELGGETVVITGDCFPSEGDISVTFGGVVATVTAVTNYYAPGSQATVTTPAYPVNAAETVDVVVTNWRTGATDTLLGGFTYNPAAPVVTGVSPASGIFGTDVTITGENFDLNATVTFNGTPATVTGQTATSITVTAPNGIGTVGVTVTNPASTLSGTLASAFTYMEPQILTISPDRGRIAGGTSVTITGNWFAADATVEFDGVPATQVVVVSDTQITCRTPAAMAAGAVEVVVIQMSGTSGIVMFTYTEGGGGAGGWGPCFVATAAYGSPMADEVATLRQFRDEVLLSNAVGTKLVEMYYTYSPAIADATSQSPALRTAMRIALVPVVALSKLMLGTSVATKLAALGLLGLALIAARRRSARSEA